jgi:hypothetical protein
MAPAPAAGPAEPQRLQDDPFARLAAWIWITVPRRLTARFPFLRDVAGDGHFLTAMPVVSVFLAVLSLVGGFWVGAHHWGYQFAVTESVFLLSALVALGAFATQLGLLAVVGFAIGDFFVRFTIWQYTVIDVGSIDFSPGATSSPVKGAHGLLDHGIIAGLWRVRVPLIIYYLLLGVGAVLVPRLARGIAGLVLRTARIPMHLDWLVASTAYVVMVWLALSGWAASVPLLLRPYFTWKGGVAGSIPPAQATVPIQHFHQQIVAAAVVAAMLRQLVVLAVSRDDDASARVDTVVSLGQPLELARPRRRRVVLLQVVGATVVATLMMAGTLERAWTWGLAAGVFLVIAVLRSPLLPARVLATWQRVAGRLPLLVRVGIIVVAVRVVAGFLATSAISSYQGLAVFVVLAALGSVLLLPPSPPVPTEP